MTQSSSSGSEWRRIELIINHDIVAFFFLLASYYLAIHLYYQLLKWAISIINKQERANKKLFELPRTCMQASKQASKQAKKAAAQQQAASANKKNNNSKPRYALGWR
jgi:hypothetical protein